MQFNAEDVWQLLQHGESETLEFKSSLRHPQDVARVIAAFANTQGGLIIVGFNELTREIISVDRKEVERIYQQALTKLQPTPATSLNFVTLNDKIIAIVSVEKSRQLVFADTGAYRRAQAQIIPMSSAEIRMAISTSNSTVEFQRLIETVARLTTEFERLQKVLEKAQGSHAKWENYLVGGFVGSVIGLLLSVLVKIFFGL